MEERLGEDWEKLWEESSGHIYQGLEWANIKEKNGKKPIFVTYYENDKLRAGILAFEDHLTTPLGRRKVLFSEGTPLFKDKRSATEILKKFKEIANKDCIYGLIRPTVINSIEDSFQESEYKKVSDATVLINLERTKEELWNNLEKKSARWGVKTGEKNKLVFQEAKNEGEIDEFYSLYSKTAKDGKFKAEPPDFMRQLFKLKDKFRIFLVKMENQVVAGGIILTDKDYTILNLTGASDDGYKLQAMPFLYWNLILFSKGIGKKYFDLGGYDKDARPGEKTYNINKFKENFGGVITEQPHFSTNNKYVFFRNIMRRFRFAKKLYKKS